MLHPDYPYLYETHLHTSQGSRCAHNTGAEMAEACKAAGYTGIFVTDHHWGGNCAVDRSLPWEDWVEGYSAGYRDAKRRGDEIGLDVFFGWESGFMGTEFLIFGLDPAWMKAHPQLRTSIPFLGIQIPPEEELTVERQYALVHAAGGMVIHAHPYREEPYIPEIRLYPDFVDGVEVINATHSNARSTGHNDPAYDDRARAYVAAHGFPTTAGSDIHSTELFGGGMAFRRRLASAQDFCRAVLSGEDYILTNGERWFDKQGNPLPETRS